MYKRRHILSQQHRDTVLEIRHCRKMCAAASSSRGGAEEGAHPPGEDEQGESSAYYECNICLDTAKDPVVSMCGHLFCWPCLHQWLETRPNRQMCPVCKAGIGKDKVVPIYGRGCTKPQDPREKLPPRPPGQRPEPENTGGGFPGFGLGDGGFHMSFGIGAFPFGMFASTLNINDGRPGPPPPASPQHAEEQFLSKFFIWVAVLFIFWLLIA